MSFLLKLIYNGMGSYRNASSFIFLMKPDDSKVQIKMNKPKTETKFLNAKILEGNRAPNNKTDKVTISRADIGRSVQERLIIQSYVLK